MIFLLTEVEAATPLPDLTFKNNLYYLNEDLYTGDVTLKTSNGWLVYHRVDGQETVSKSVLKFSGSIKNGRRDGEWITTYPYDFKDFKIVECYDNGTLKSIDIYRKPSDERVLKLYIEGKLINLSNRWQWTVYSSNIYRTITYSGQTIGVTPKDKSISFFSENGRDYTSLKYIDKAQANLKFQIFHVILHKSDSIDNRKKIIEGPAEIIRDGRWEVLDKQGQIFYAKDYIYGRNPLTYSAKLEYDDDGASEFLGYWRQEDGRREEKVVYDTQRNILDYRLNDPEKSIKRHEKYYPNGYLQFVNLPINDKKNYVLLEYYPTGELFKQRIFESEAEDISWYLGFDNSNRKLIGDELIYNLQGVLINPPNENSPLKFENPKRLNQKTARELIHKLNQKTTQNLTYENK